MRKLSLLCAAFFVAALFPAEAGEEKKKADEPSEAHKAMAKLAGEYTTASKFKIPDGKEFESKGTSKLTVILDGRFVKEEGTGEMAGKPIASFKLFGFNNGSGKYEAVWTYTGSTGMMVLVGEKKSEGKVDFIGTTVGDKGMKQEFLVRYNVIDDDTFTMELTARGGPSKGASLTATYTRKK